jgi:eukaryotic-like serine/threonine-protein kinase
MVGELQAGDPRSVGPYELVGRLGGGGMGRVFLGRSAGGRLVAVKVIRPELAGEPGFRTRFAREVAAARNVSGLYTALVVDADTDGREPWLATAYVAGPSLAEAVEAGGPLPTAWMLTLAAGLAEGLQAIHAAGVVHRDLKPANVLLAHDGPRVIDFGIARAAEASVLTQSGMVVGSPGFMSPEQAEGREVGPASDVFSLGAVLAFAATGQGPFGTGSTAALIYRVVHGEPDVSGVPSEIRPLVRLCLAKDPDERPATAELLAEFGAGRLVAGWLPASLAEMLGRYMPPGTREGRAAPDSAPAAGAAEESAADMPAGPSTVTSARRRRTPTQAVDAGPGVPGLRTPRKKRRYLLWVPAVAGLMAASAAAAIIMPGLLRDAAVIQRRVAAGRAPAPGRAEAAMPEAAIPVVGAPVVGAPPSRRRSLLRRPTRKACTSTSA